MNRPRLKADIKPPPPTKLYDDLWEEKTGAEMLEELYCQATEEQKKAVKEEDEEEEEEEDEERSYESDEKSDQNGDFAGEPVVVKSQISDPGEWGQRHEFGCPDVTLV